MEKGTAGVEADDDPDSIRVAGIYQRWLRGYLHRARRSLFEIWTFEALSVWIVLGLLFLLPDLESVFWGSRHWPVLFQFAFAWHHRHPIGYAALVLPPVNALLLEILLAERTPRDSSLRVVLRVLRPVVASLPLLGLYMIPVWRWLEEHRPIWAFRPRPVAPLDLRAPAPKEPGRMRTAIERWIRTPAASLSFTFWLWSVNLVMLRVGLSRLGASEALTPELRLVLCCLLHVVGLVCTMIFIEARRRHSPVSPSRLLVLRLIAGLWLLPLPLCLLGFYAFVAIEPRPGRLGTLTRFVHGESGPARLASFRRALGSHARRQPWYRRWRLPWGLERTSQAGEVHLRLLSLYRVKILLLSFDGLALACLLIWLGSRTEWSLLLSALLICILCLGAIVGFLAGALIYGIQRLRTRVVFGQTTDLLDPYPHSRYLILSQAAFGIGLALSLTMAIEKTQWIGLLLGPLGMCGILALPSGLPTEGIGRAPWGVAVRCMMWAGMYTLLCILGLRIWLDANLALQVANYLVLAAVGTPVWAVAFGVKLSGDVIQPFGWRHMVAAQLPWRLRLVLAAMALSAALPLGGLAVPLWMLAREKLWPELERTAHEVLENERPFFRELPES